MKKKLTGSISLLAALSALTPPPVQAQTQAQTPFAFKSVNTNLPAGDRTFPGGSAADAVNGNCLTCHSAGMVLNQPALSRQAWETEVNKMIKVYKAPVSADSVPAIVAYLASNGQTK